MSLPRVLCVVGPTAVGKSEVAELVALELGGDVVSVDSMQVYRGMDIGTAKVPEAERACPVHMVDVADPRVPYSVSLFQRDARTCIDELLECSRVPVLCGGTGLYLDAVIDCMEFPEGDTVSEARAAWHALAEREGPEALHALLAAQDPESAARIHPHNTVRVVRALELLSEGRSYARVHDGLRARSPYYDARIWALTFDRTALYARIDARVKRMVESGLVHEVRQLRASGQLGPITAGKAIGYREILAYLAGETSLDEAVALIQRNTRHYAKRQLSWIRRDGRARMLPLDDKTPQDAARIICDEWRQS